MDSLQYALMTIALFAVGCIIALYVCRTLYRVHTRWKREEDRREALARIEEQDRKTKESWGLED